MGITDGLLLAIHNAGFHVSKTENQRHISGRWSGRQLASVIVGTGRGNDEPTVVIRCI
jgi:hypothetical protein